MGSDGSKEYRAELAFLDYCNSGGVGWDLAFIGMASFNFTESLIETFNIKDEEMLEKYLDDLSVTTEIRFNNLIDYIYNELNINDDN